MAAPDQQIPADMFNVLTQTRHGPMIVNRNDRYVGQSLIQYGEMCEGEAALFRQLVGPADVVLEAGANIGAHTLLFSQLTGPQGRVFAYEPQRIVFQTLCGNLALNQCTNVIARQQGLGKARGAMMAPAPDPRQPNNFGGLSLHDCGHGEAVEVVDIDSLQLPCLRLIKADVEGMEAGVVAGARQTISRCRPWLYLENDREDSSAELIGLVQSLGYRLWWHVTPLFNADNFRGNRNNVFGGTVSINMFCQPSGTARPVAGMREILHATDRWRPSSQ